MSLKPMKPLPKQQVKVDLKQADTIKCKECNNYLFIVSYVLKKLSALISPTGEEALVPIQVYSCGNCGTVSEGMLDGIGFEEEQEKDSFPSLDI
jgi:hypothetical protein